MMMDILQDILVWHIVCFKIRHISTYYFTDSICYLIENLFYSFENLNCHKDECLVVTTSIIHAWVVIDVKVIWKEKKNIYVKHACMEELTFFMQNHFLFFYSLIKMRHRTFLVWKHKNVTTYIQSMRIEALIKTRRLKTIPRLVREFEVLENKIQLYVSYVW